MGGSESGELEASTNQESTLLPKDHGEKELPETVEARRVDHLWRTILSTGNNNSEGMKEPSQRGRQITLADWQPVELELPPRPFSSSQDQEMVSIAKTEQRSHPVDAFQRLPYLDSTTQSLAASSVYANFFYNTCIPREDVKPPFAVPVRPTPNHVASSSSGALPGHGNNNLLINLSFTAVVPASERKNLDMATLLQRQLGNKCPRSSELLTSIITSVEEAVQEHGSGSGTSGGLSSDFEDDDDDDDDEEEEEEEEVAHVDQNQVCEPEHDQLKAAIIEHPLYPVMVLTHIRILKIGAPSGLHAKLDDLTRKFQRFQVGENSKLGKDPELDYFMRSYVELLTRFREELEEPFTKLMQFMDSATKDLEDLCGHYVETKPAEEDNYGFDIGSMDGAQDSDDQEMLEEENLLHPTDIDDSIVVDPDASEEELKKVLMKKYGRHIGGLKAEFNRVRKKGKLPCGARQILKEWFNRHSYWPYPSEMEKAYLQRLCNLDLKQINNWFINERKRHWISEEKCMHPNTKFYDDSNGEGTGHLEQ